MLEPQIESLVASDGYRLKLRRWRPMPTRRALVVALHGIQSHGGWYELSCRRLSENGYDVLFLDRRGSGLNTARRGDAPHADRLVNDVVQVLAQIRRLRMEWPSPVPVVLLGVSWGGKLAAVVAARRPDLVDGLALLYPGICSRFEPNLWQRFRLSLARRLDIRDPRIAIPLGDPALFTAQPAWQEFIRRDPLALRDVSVGFLLAHQELTIEALQAAPHLECPLLMMLAGKDRIVDNAASRDWMRQAGSAEAVLHVYSEAQHTLEFEPQPEVFLNDLLNWLASLPAVKV